jgi:hypothetical protein
MKVIPGGIYGFEHDEFQVITAPRLIGTNTCVTPFRAQRKSIKETRSLGFT